MAQGLTIARARPAGLALGPGVAALVGGTVWVAALLHEAVLGRVSVHARIPAALARAGPTARDDVLHGQVGLRPGARAPDVVPVGQGGSGGVGPAGPIFERAFFFFRKEGRERFFFRLRERFFFGERKKTPSQKNNSPAVLGQVLIAWRAQHTHATGCVDAPVEGRRERGAVEGRAVSREARVWGRGQAVGV